MNSKALLHVLETHGHAAKEGDRLDFSKDSAVTIYAALGSEVLTITSISSVKLSDDLVIAQTRKDETFVVPAEDVRACRFGREQEKRRTGLV